MAKQPAGLNYPEALRTASRARAETIYAQILNLKLETRLLRVRTLLGHELSINLIQQIWVHRLQNLGEQPQTYTTFHAALVPGRWVCIRCLVYPSIDGDHIEAFELIVVSSDGQERLHHNPDWWIKQISQLADFYLTNLFSYDQFSSFDFSRHRTNLGLTGSPCSANDGRQETAILSRHIYGFATAFLLTGKSIYLEAARKGSEYLQSKFSHYDEEADGIYWFHGRDFLKDGSSVAILASEAGDDFDAIACYEQIYALAGIAQTFRACGDPKLLSVCLATIRFLRDHFRDHRAAGGYFSHIDPITFSPLEDSLGRNHNRKNWNSIGDHVPAYLLQLYLATKNPELQAMLVELQQLLLLHFQPSEGNLFIEERFHGDWSTDHSWGWQNNRTVVGHNLKLIWNLLRLEQLNSDSRTLPTCKQLAMNTIQFGFDGLRSGWFDMIDREPPHHLCWHDRKAWWQQEQGILAFQLLHAYDSSNDLWAKIADASADFYNCWHLDHDRGGVYFAVTADGVAWLKGEEGHKGSHSMGGYHAFELCFCASTYGNLLLREEALTLNFEVIPNQLLNRRLHVSPDLLPAGKIKISSALANNQVISSYNSNELWVELPAGDQPLSIKIKLDAQAVNFELREINNANPNSSDKSFYLEGYLCETFLHHFRSRMESLANVDIIQLDATGLQGSCPQGLRYLSLLSQHNRSNGEVRLINLSEQLQKEIASYLQ